MRDGEPEQHFFGLAITVDDAQQPIPEEQQAVHLHNLSVVVMVGGGEPGVKPP
jgi:hypothetical protein